MLALPDIIEPQRPDTIGEKCAPGEVTDQSSHSRGLTRIFTGHLLGSHWCKVFSCGQRRLKSARADAQANFSLRWASLSESTFSHVLVHTIGQLYRKCNSLKWLHFEVDSLHVSTALFGPTYRTTGGKCFRPKLVVIINKLKQNLDK